VSQITPAELKQHLSLASDFVGDDVRLQGLIGAADSITGTATGDRVDSRG
jgi:hypothetical protein